MSKVNRLAVAICLGTITVGLPIMAGATSGGQPRATIDTDIITWEQSRAAYLRDLALSSAALDSWDCNDYATKTNLINARYFIRIAEIEDEDLNQRESARQDLQRAQHFLALAKGEVNASDQAQIQQLLNELPIRKMEYQSACDNIEQNEQRQHYDRMASELDDLVNSI